MRTGLLLASVVLLASPAGAAPPTFVEQVETYARDRAFTVTWISDYQLDEDPELEHVAWLCHTTAKGGHDALFVVEQDPGVLWSLHQAEGSEEPCPAPKLLPPGPPPSRLEFVVKLPGDSGSATGSVAFREGKLVTLSRGHSHDVRNALAECGHSLSFTSQGENWAELSFSQSSWYQCLTRDHSDIAVPSTIRDRRGGLIPVLATPARTHASTYNLLIRVPKNWPPRHEQLAHVQVDALFLEEPSRVRLRIHVTDDVLLPAHAKMADKELLGVDHLELWWSPMNPAPETPANRQLAVARTAKGEPVVRWLFPAHFTEPLPHVTLEGDDFLIDLAPAHLGLVPELKDNWSLPFTVVFSDSDAVGTKQPVVTGTSMVKPNDATTFGRLIALKGLARYPTMPNDDEPEWNDIPIPPGENLPLTAAGLPAPPTPPKP
ncbi:hypothetical protein KRR26_08120 [Corallococcus sp. M34]|uniref:hypothetical protein n=1 Tax=Citreicoccus inhibens TaxID=2849499 RepID=UPI001C24D477|nr:hypothetical protein [Citreicoccus inhibens]MBU8895568.1 hypothetical protein [Citreicoccus inhibens]